jgi:thiamine biosynthesis lipoprotein
MTSPWRAIFVCVALLAACDRTPPVAQLVVNAHQSMGSEVRVSVWTDRATDARAAMAAVFAEFDRLDALLSVWKADSDVARINAAAGRAPVRVDRETIHILRTAQQVSDWSEGKFDVTFGTLSDVWKFDHDRDNRVPSRAEIAARLPLIDYKAVVIDDGNSTVLLSRAGMRIHLGGIGKGHAVDRAAAILRGGGFGDFMIQAGGDLYVAGTSGQGPWRLGINDPRGAPGDSFAVVELSDATFSTSGDYERFFIKDGVRYHHILDPETGDPARGCVSVTIVSASAILADAMSTAVFLLGPEKGMALIERRPDLQAVIVTASNQVLVSSGLRDRIELRRTPTPRRP